MTPALMDDFKAMLSERNIRPRSGRVVARERLDQ